MRLAVRLVILKDDFDDFFGSIPSTPQEVRTDLAISLRRSTGS